MNSTSSVNKHPSSFASNDQRSKIKEKKKKRRKIPQLYRMKEIKEIKVKIQKENTNI